MPLQHAATLIFSVDWGLEDFEEWLTVLLEEAEAVHGDGVRTLYSEEAWGSAVRKV